MRLRLLVAAALLAGLTACGATDFAERSETIERTLTVREIDKTNRSFVVTGDGQRFILRVSEAVVNFDQIEVGDKLNVEYVESVTVAMAEPEDDGATIVADAVLRAREGDKPGLASAEMVSRVVEFVNYDPSSKLVTVRTSDNNLLVTKLKPELRAFAASRKPGDRIVVDTLTGFAVAVRPAG